VATDASTPADERGQLQVRRVVVLIGPAVLLAGCILVIGSLFLPWYHADPRYLVNDPYPGDLLPFVPIQSFNVEDVFWLGLQMVPLITALVCLGVDAIPFLRRGWLVLGAAISFGVVTILAGAVGVISLLLFPGFLTLAGTVPKILDWGYYVALAGYILLLPGVILLIIGQTHVREQLYLNLRSDR